MLEQFVEEIEKEGKRIISSDELDKVRENGYTVEQLFDYIAERYGMLMHGSRDDIKDGYLKAMGRELFASDIASIALMRAIISNRGLTNPGLVYPYRVDDDSPLEVNVFGMHKDTIAERGFVYLVDGKGFVNNPKGSWQFTKQGKSDIKYKFEVVKADLKYPVYADGERVL